MATTTTKQSASLTHKHRSVGAKKGHGRMKSGQKIHIRGVGEKEQRMYEHIKASSRKYGHYGKRLEEIAARTVLKHHKEEGHAPGR